MAKIGSDSMDGVSGVMDYFSSSGAGTGGHFGALQRLHPSRLPLGGIGLIPRKQQWLDGRFTNSAFSFILRGQGIYHSRGKQYAVRAPCVLTQRSGEHFRYGPDGTWDEVFLAYDAPVLDELRRCVFIDPDWPLWSINDVSGILRPLDELVALLPDAERLGVVDRIDRLAEAAILASLLDQRRASADPRQHAIAAIAAIIEGHPERPVDIDQLARQHDLAPSTFRRLWQQVRGEPPHRFQDRVRLRRACRLLVETDRPIATIATTLGYADPLYFSRRFRQLIGTTASAYRRRNVLE